MVKLWLSMGMPWASSSSSMKLSMLVVSIVQLAAVVLLFPGESKVASAFYVPGVHPKSFDVGEEVPLKVNSLTSIHTQVPRDYYKLPYCIPSGGPSMFSENLGEFLSGNKIQNSPYIINMMRDKSCMKLCQVTLNKESASKLRLHIKYGYHNNWIVDNLPSAAIGVANVGGQRTSRRRYAGGFPVGFTDPNSGNSYVNNHVNIELDYFEVQESDGSSSEHVTRYRVVAFAVEPVSVKHKFADASFKWDGFSSEGMNKDLKTCDLTSHEHAMALIDVSTAQLVVSGEEILYTYSVTWRKSDVEWSSRWDIYLSEGHLVPPQVHWYSITNSILVVLFLSLLVISILVRNLRRDIAAYNAIAATLADDLEKDEEADETGWKLVHADVFRPPASYPMMYCVFLGSGSQLALTVLFAIVLSAVGFLSPARRGSLINAFLAFYVLLGIVAGYVSSRLYKAFRGRQWQLCTIITALFYPGICFGTFLFFNIILYFLQSSASAPVIDVVIVAAMWCCVSVPLVFVGAYFGYKQESIEFPTITSTIARAIPPSSWMLNPHLGMALTGVIPFAAAYVELFFIMTSLWMDQFYYVFGFTLIVYIILIITCAEATVLLVYYQLCAENHRWWWFAFLASGSTAIYTFIYSIFWFKSLEASRMLMTYLLYFGYMFLISLGMLLLFGTVGALTSLWFVKKIFSTIKVD